MSDLKKRFRRRVLGRRFQQRVEDHDLTIKNLANQHYIASHPDLIATGHQLPLSAYEYSVFSQNGEDGILLYLLSCIGVKNHYMVEIGIQDGRECNSGQFNP